MRIKFSPEVDKELKKIKQKNLQLAQRIEKQLTLFRKNPKHSSLRLHKLTGSLSNLWSISITRSIRMVYVKEDDEAYFIDIGTHDQVYKK